MCWKIEDLVGRIFPLLVKNLFLVLLLANYFQNCSARITSFNFLKIYSWYVIIIRVSGHPLGSNLSFSVLKRISLISFKCPFLDWFIWIFTFLLPFFLTSDFFCIRYLNVCFLVYKTIFSRFYDRQQKIKNYSCHPAFILSLPVVDKKMPFNLFLHVWKCKFLSILIPDLCLDFVFNETCI